MSTSVQLLEPVQSLDPTDAASTEDRHIALQLWWERNGDTFSVWFESLTKENQILHLRKASPDIPTQTAGSRESEGQTLSASDVLLPELTIDGLLGANGKLMALFFKRRCLQTDRCYFADLQLLNTMFSRGEMPLFSQGALDGMDAPFVDPADRDENVRSLNSDTPTGNRASVIAHLITGRLIHAEVFVTLKIRRAALVHFMVVIVEAFERSNIGKVSPTYSALLMSELDQQRVTQEMAENHNEEDEKEEVEAS
jgi:hypothetical protein